MTGRGNGSSKKRTSLTPTEDVTLGQYHDNGPICHTVNIPIGEETLDSFIALMSDVLNNKSGSLAEAAGTDSSEPSSSRAQLEDGAGVASSSGADSGPAETAIQIFARKKSSPCFALKETMKRTVLLADLKANGVFYFGDWIEWQNLPEDDKLREAWTEEKFSKPTIPADEIPGDNFRMPFFPSGVTLNKKECEDIWGKDWFKTKTLDTLYCQWHQQMTKNVDK